MRLNLHQLKIFATVAEMLNITQAAKQLHMTQPAVSIQLKQLENYYGLPLLELVGKRLQLTDAGKELFKACQDVSARLAQVEMNFAAMEGCLKGRLSIAVVSTAKYFVPHLLGKFHKLYPEVEIKLKVTNRATVIERLQDNLDDLVILSQLPDKLAVESKPILEDLLVIAAPVNHRLAKLKKIHLKDLKQEDFIMREPGSGTRMVMEKIFNKYKIKPKVIMELGSSEAIKQAVMAGIGLSLLSELSLKSELELKHMVVLNVAELPWAHHWYAVYRKGKVLSPIAKNFLNFLLQSDINTV